MADVGQPFAVQPFAALPPRQPQPGYGRRTRVQTTVHGHYIRATIPQEPIRRLNDLALDATLRAAALRQTGAGNGSWAGLPITAPDYRQKIRETRTGNLILFVVDASGSMAARQRMVAVKGAILSLLLDAYQKRDQVGLIVFRGAGAELLLPSTNSVDQAQRLLSQLPTGGRTPLASGLVLAARVLQQRRFAGDHLTPLLVLLSDGRANVGLDGMTGNVLDETFRIAAGLAHQKISTLVIDCETGRQRFGLARSLAEVLSARYLRLEELAADSLARSIQTYLEENRWRG